MFLIFFGFTAEENPKNKLIISFISIVLILAAAFRYGIGTDYENYLMIFEGSNKTYDWSSSLSIEWGYFFLNKVIFNLGLGYWAVSLICSIIMFISLFRVLKTFSVNIYIGLAVYVSLWYMGFNYNIVRHGMATSLVWVAFTFIPSRKFVKFLACIFVAGAFHKIAYVFIPFYWLLRLKINFKVALISIILSHIIGLSINIYSNPLLQRFLSDRTKVEHYISNYYDGNNGRYGISYGSLLNLFWVCCIYILKKYKYKDMKILTNSLIYALCLIGILNSLSVFVERLSGVLLYSLVGIIPVFLISKKRNIFIGSFFVILFYCSFYYFTTLNSKERDGSLQYVPYQSIINK